MATPPLPAPSSDRTSSASSDDRHPPHLRSDPSNPASDASRPPNSRPQDQQRFTPFASETSPSTPQSTPSSHGPRASYGTRANPHTPQLPTNPIQLLPESIDIRTSQPLPLTASQEAEVRDLYYANVRRACAPQIRAFAECCTGRTFSISWACRGQRREMNGCMNGVAGRRAEDEAREEWFRRIPERAEERRREEEWKEGQRRKKREWWGLDEQGRRILDEGGKDKEKRG